MLSVNSVARIGSTANLRVAVCKKNGSSKDAALAADLKERGMKRIGLILFAASVMFAMTAMADDMGKSMTVNGWVSDSVCGVKGANEGAADCTKKCLAKGAKVVIVTDGDQKVLMVDNPDKLMGHEGHHIAVTGSVKGDSIHVDSMKML
jgi:hypothetical protein